MYYLKLYLLTLAVFLGLDSVWLGVVSRGFYSEQLGYLMRPSPQWVAAGAFYFFNIFGILIFVVLPALERKSMGRAGMLGILFGFFTYATYDLTNLATVRDWPLRVTFVDLGWGMILTGVVSSLSYLIATRIRK